jgi:hypothetical protein
VALAKSIVRYYYSISISSEHFISFKKSFSQDLGEDERDFSKDKDENWRSPVQEVIMKAKRLEREEQRLVKRDGIQPEKYPRSLL